MYKKSEVAIVIPAYNEEKLITKTVTSLPDFIDYVIVVNDASTDDTLDVITKLSKTESKLVIVDNEKNAGVGASVVNGFRKAIDMKVDIIGVMAGDAQCDPTYIQDMLDELISNKLDYVKANRFVHLDELGQMPLFRRVGNIVITILTKFATGYYSVFDSQNGYGFFTRSILERINLKRIGNRYDYENTLLLELAYLGAKIEDIPVPAIYGDEVSSIPVIKTVRRALSVLWSGFWRRIYYRYILYNFHPIALFLFGGLLLTFLGSIYGAFLLFEKIVHHLSPSSGTVMLAVLPLILGFQLLLTAFILDVFNEGK